MRTLLRLLPAMLLLTSPLRAQGPGWWPQWRGPSGQGVATDAKVPLEWSATKNLLWETKLPGIGHSTPIVWGTHIFLTCTNPSGSERRVVCLSTDGKIRWQRTIEAEAEKNHQTSNHATASCVTDGKRVYVFFGTPGLLCYDFEGKLLWHHRFGTFTSETNWGVGASPVLFENLVIQNCDNDGPDALRGGSPKQAAPMNLVALDKETGKEVWSTPRNQGRGFSTPVFIATPAGRTDLVLNGPLGVWGYDPKTGKELWHCYRHPDDDKNRFGEPMPLYAGGLIFAAAGRGNGYLQAIKPDGNGDVTASGVAWELQRRGIRDVGSGVLAGDCLIFADGQLARLSAHDAKTGRELFAERSPGSSGARGGKGFYASPLLLNGKVLCLRQDGVTFVLEPGPELKIVRENVLSDGTDFSASPSVADGKIYLRSQTHLYCIGNN